MSLHIGVYPGSFDPITKGHMDVVQRAIKLVDQLIIAIALSPGKSPLFSVSERVALVEQEISSLEIPTGKKITVEAFDTLMVDFAYKRQACIIIRGLRAVSDFEYELQMAWTNGRLAPHIETVFLMATDRHQFVSSRFVKEIARLNGDIHQFVSSHVASKIQQKLKSD
jgi:pantetheine-phosphate adenylyltransferase